MRYANSPNHEEKFHRSRYEAMLARINNTCLPPHQRTHSGTGQNAMGESAPTVSMEAIYRPMGIRIEVCNPYDPEKTTGVLAGLMAMESGVRLRVIIMKRD